MEQESYIQERHGRAREPAHPTILTYIRIATILGVITAVEVAIFYVDFLEPAFIGIFLVLSAVKFTLVILFYMHLKFDSRLFSNLFIGGLLLAAGVLVALLALFRVFTD
ncbi:MAG: cytochrome C oxidase subunit IV family protein [Dehalococcoidia bacterium]